MKLQINLSKIIKAILCLVITFTLLEINAFAAGQNKVKSEKENAKQSGQLTLWRAADKTKIKDSGRLLDVSQKYLVYRLNMTGLKNLLANAPLEFSQAARDREVILEIPDPQGKLVRFRMEESPMLAPVVNLLAVV